MPGWNPFLGILTAQTCARARPDYHPEAVAAAVRLLDLSTPVRLAVDVGCGTGMFTRAARAIADQAVGLDASRPMLIEAGPLAGVQYIHAQVTYTDYFSGQLDGAPNARTGLSPRTAHRSQHQLGGVTLTRRRSKRPASGS